MKAYEKCVEDCDAACSEGGQRLEEMVKEQTKVEKLLKVSGVRRGNLSFSSSSSLFSRLLLLSISRAPPCIDGMIDPMAGTCT